MTWCCIRRRLRAAALVLAVPAGLLAVEGILDDGSWPWSARMVVTIVAVAACARLAPQGARWWRASCTTNVHVQVAIASSAAWPVVDSDTMHRLLAAIVTTGRTTTTGPAEIGVLGLSPSWRAVTTHPLTIPEEMWVADDHDIVTMLGRVTHETNGARLRDPSWSFPASHLGVYILTGVPAVPGTDGPTPAPAGRQMWVVDRTGRRYEAVQPNAEAGAVRVSAGDRTEITGQIPERLAVLASAGGTTSRTNT